MAWLRRIGMPLAEIAEVRNALSGAVSAAASALRELAGADPELAGTGSTLTAMLWSGSRLALVHR